MVVDNVHLRWPRIRPAKTDAVLVINADAMLSLAIPFQGLKPVAWGNLVFMECGHGCQADRVCGRQSSTRIVGRCVGLPVAPPAVEDVLRARVLE